MDNRKFYIILSFFTASVWFANGLFCKILGFVPRHEQIVSRIIGESHSSEITILIGILEVGMALWIISDFKPKLNAIVQITAVGLMNVLEFFLAPDLLLWGKLNIVFAAALIAIVYYHKFILRNRIIKYAIA